MVMINRQEKEAILERYPNTQMVRTMRQDSKRHHYYCVETREIRDFLRTMRRAGEYHGAPRGKRHGK